MRIYMYLILHIFSIIQGGNINKKEKEIIEWIVFLVVLLLVWSHVNVVVSDSMVPVMKRGDFVLVSNTNWEFNPNDVQIGDIVVYKAHWATGKFTIIEDDIPLNNKTLYLLDGQTTKPVIHRIIDKVQYKNNTYIITKGDNNPVNDPELISVNQIKQKVITINGAPLVIPYLGYISIILKENIILVILLIVVWYAYDYLRNSKSNNNNKSKNNKK
jgi:signal peptidase